MYQIRDVASPPCDIYLTVWQAFSIWILSNESRPPESKSEDNAEDCSISSERVGCVDLLS